jgi:hypothetical protein
LPKITKAILDKGGRDYATIIAEWPAMVGPALAGSSQPEKLARRRTGDERSAGGVLTLRVTGGAALEIQHREPQIIERINSYLGYRAVARLKLVQGVPTRRPAPGLPPMRELTPAESQTIESAASPVADPDLRSGLARFGRALAARAERPRR